MKYTILFVELLFLWHITVAQEVRIDDTKDCPILQINESGFANVICIYDSLIRIDKIYGRVACVCDFDKRGKVKKIDVLWFFQKYPINRTYMQTDMDPCLYKTIVDNLEIQIRTKGVVICPRNVSIMGSRQSFSIPIVIRRSREQSSVIKEKSQKKNNR